MGLDITPSKECLNRVVKLREYLDFKNKTIEESLNVARISQNEAKIAIERQKAAEVTLSQAIQNFSTEDEGGKEEDYSYKLKN